MAKDDDLKIRLTVREKELLRQAAESTNMSLSDFVRLAAVRMAMGTLAFEPGREAEFVEYVTSIARVFINRIEERAILSASPSPEIPPEGDE